MPSARFFQNKSLKVKKVRGEVMNRIIVGIIMIIMIAIDQLTKVWAVHTLGQGYDLSIWEGVLHFQYLENQGAAWGIFGGKQIFLIGLTSVIIAVMLYYLIKLPKTAIGKWYRVALVLIISGAIGNLIDRISLQYVRDFIYFKLINFPIFNVADIFVVCGVILLMLVILIIDKSESNEEDGNS